MKISLSVIALFFLMTAQSAWAQQLPAADLPAGESLGPKPKLMIEETVYEVKDIPPGSQIAHEFIFRNEGDAPLEFLDIQTGCSCTLAEFDRVIAPGEMGKIKILVRVYPEWAGRQFARASWVTTNDPVSAQVQLLVKGNVLPIPGSSKK